MTRKTYTMIDPAQIAKKGYKGCKTTTSVQNFCKNNNVDCCWWKPQGTSQKVMMIEWNSFRNAYQQAKTGNTMKTNANRTKKSTTRTTNRKSNITSITSRTKKNNRSSYSTWGTKSAWGKTTQRRPSNARRTYARSTKTRRAA